MLRTAYGGGRSRRRCGSLPERAFKTRDSSQRGRIDEEEQGIPSPEEATPLEPVDATLTVLVCLLIGALPFLEPPLGFILVSLGTAAAFQRQCAPALHVGVVGALTAVLSMVPALRALWPLPLLAGIGLDVLVTVTVSSLQDTAPWWRRGRLGAVELSLALGFALIAGVTVIGWYRLLHPDLSDLALRIPQVSTALLVVLGLVFATTNAFAEEVYFRGMVLHALDQALGEGIAALSLQAVVFGMVHVEGFPRGVVGVVLAAVYAAVMGGIRRRSEGLLAVWISHVVVDLVVFAVVVKLAQVG